MAAHRLPCFLYNPSICHFKAKFIFANYCNLVNLLSDIIFRPLTKNLTYYPSEVIFRYNSSPTVISILTPFPANPCNSPCSRANTSPICTSAYSTNHFLCKWINRNIRLSEYQLFTPLHYTFLHLIESCAVDNRLVVILHIESWYFAIILDLLSEQVIGNILFLQKQISRVGNV